MKIPPNLRLYARVPRWGKSNQYQHLLSRLSPPSGRLEVDEHTAADLNECHIRGFAVFSPLEGGKPLTNLVPDGF